MNKLIKDNTQNGTIKLKIYRHYSLSRLPNRRRQDWFRLFNRPRNKTDLRKSCLSDDLNDTVDYVLLNKIVVEEMEIRPIY
jgi:dihydroneopterin aldolase